MKFYGWNMLRVMAGLFQMAVLQILFLLYSINDYILSWFIAHNVQALALPIYLGT